ncbi:hypothetical protein A176_007148 [Myxococcus hansupus]|uniref:Uncharacterized protein n=1 Tax=Pseudomyxococcus hansupus TaxID=1297742 RepID=A0A0H4X3J3_9BACT|nr:hypothetical protein A176_007148 [Myxococcus hansupus]
MDMVGHIIESDAAIIATRMSASVSDPWTRARRAVTPIHGVW